MPIPPPHRGAAEAAELLRLVSAAGAMLAMEPQSPALRAAAREKLRRLGLERNSLRMLMRIVAASSRAGALHSRPAIRFDGRPDDPLATIDALTVAHDIELDSSRRRGIAYCLSTTIVSVTR